jgi:hypothetical protein
MSYPAQALETSAESQSGLYSRYSPNGTSSVETSILPSIVKDLRPNEVVSSNPASDTAPPSPRPTLDTGTEPSPETMDPLPRLPVFAPTQGPRFVALQEWEGVVTEIGDDHFIARLVDLWGRTRTADEEASFPRTEVSDDDQRLLRAGAIFRWVIGFQKLRGGTKQRISQVVFRRLPQWTKEDISNADEISRQWSAIFNERR